MDTLPAETAAAFPLLLGEGLRIEATGQQVCDIVAFRLGDIGEWLSNGRSFDYAGKVYFSVGDTLFSNRSKPMLRITSDDVGRHDFLYAACSQEMYRIQYTAALPHPNCLDNLTAALAPYGVAADHLPTPFNVFQNSTVQQDGRLVIEPPLSKPGDAIEFTADMDLVIGLSACAASLCNGGRTMPVHYEVRASI